MKNINLYELLEILGVLSVESADDDIAEFALKLQTEIIAVHGDRRLH